MDLPVLSQLALRAPGTNQHSHAVGQLAEDACRTVGANPLLARIGALYHDIGKLAAPEYFVENQQGIIRTITCVRRKAPGSLPVTSRMVSAWQRRLGCREKSRTSFRSITAHARCISSCARPRPWPSPVRRSMRRIFVILVRSRNSKKPPS